MNIDRCEPWLVVEFRPTANIPAVHLLIDRTAPPGCQHVATFASVVDADAAAVVMNDQDRAYRSAQNARAEKEPF